MILTEKQQTIIMALRQNGRQKINELARRKGIATSSLTDTLHRMENAGILDHKTHVAFEKVGFPVRILAAVKTDNRNRGALKEFLAASKHVNTLHAIDSGYDYHFEGVFKNQKEAQDFLDLLEEKNAILYKQVYHVIDTIHEESFLKDASHFE